MAHNIIYLAAPYTHADLAVRRLRFEQVTALAAEIISRGKIVFSPITMTHPIDRLLAEADTTLGSDYWVDFDEAFMEICSEIFVLKLDGWQSSSGVRREIQYFERAGKPITYLEP